MEEQLLILLETKMFNELIPSEKEYALSQISEKEYYEQQEIIRLSREIIKDEISDIPFNISLYNTILKTENTENKKKIFLSQKVSLARVVAVFLISFFSYHLILKHIYETQEIDTIIVNNTDTVYKTKKIYTTDTVFLTEYKTIFVKKDCKENNVFLAQAKPEQKISEQQYELYKKKVINNLKNKKNHKGKRVEKLPSNLNIKPIITIENIYVKRVE